LKPTLKVTVSNGKGVQPGGLRRFAAEVDITHVDMGHELANGGLSMDQASA
jgi:hypothetical protein